MRRFTDLHQHVLWGMDDGPASPQAMHAMLECAAKGGVGLIAATPHAYVHHKAFDRALYEQRLSEANAFCAQKEWPLRLISGCEILWCSRAADLLRDGALPMLGDSRHVLVEFLPEAPLESIARAADAIYKAGCVPILAHVERYRALKRTILHPLRFKEDCGFVYQMNCDTLIRPQGILETLFVRRMMEEQAIDLLASDAHDTVIRPVRMRQAYRIAKREYGPQYARALVGYGSRLIDAPDGRLSAEETR